MVVLALISPLVTMFPQLLLIQYGRQGIFRNVHTHLTQTNQFPDWAQILMAHCHVGFTAVVGAKEMNSFAMIFQCQTMETLNSICGYFASSSDIFLRFAAILMSSFSKASDCTEQRRGDLVVYGLPSSFVAA